MIANYLQSMGCVVYFSDFAAKRIIETDAQVKREIIAAFGEEAYSGDKYNNAYISDRVFSNSQLLSTLNAIVHPRVFEDLRQFAFAAQSPFIIVESAILFESGMDAICDAVVCVVAPLDFRIECLVTRDNITREQAVNRINSQMTDSERILRSDLVIRNYKNVDLAKLYLEIQNFLCKFAG